MPEPLFKLMGKKSAKVETIGASVLDYELKHPEYAQEIAPLVHEDCEIGIEIEVENLDGKAIPYAMWQTKPDGSLRNNGLEFVSHPLKGKRIHFALNQFFDYLCKGAHFSPRTSIHIHVNVLNLTQHQIAGMLMAYVVVEKLMYKFAGGDRDKNNFCVPMGEVYVPNLLKIFITEPLVLPNYENNRYLGLNIDAIRKFGTLEFRHLGGTKDKTRIVQWINLVLSLKKFAENYSLENIKDRIDKLNTNSGYALFVDDVFGPCGSYLDQRTIFKDMTPMVSVVKKLTIVNTFFNEIVASVTEKSCFYEALTGKSKEALKDYWYPANSLHRPLRPRRAPPARDTAARPVQTTQEMLESFATIAPSPAFFTTTDTVNQEEAVRRTFVRLGIDRART